MSPLEMKKLKVELIQVQAGRAGLELRIEERLDEIERLKEHVAVSLKKEQELDEKIKKEEI